MMQSGPRTNRTKIIISCELGEDIEKGHQCSPSPRVSSECWFGTGGWNGIYIWYMPLSYARDWDRGDQCQWASRMVNMEGRDLQAGMIITLARGPGVQAMSWESG
jgi:hypothetical protein